MAETEGAGGPEPVQPQPIPDVLDAATVLEPIAATESPTREKATTAAELLTQKKDADIQKDMRSSIPRRKATEDEAALLLVGKYATGFADHFAQPGATVDSINLTVTTKNGESVLVKSLTGQTVNAEGDVEYSYDAVSMDGKFTPVQGAELLGTDLASAQLSQKKDQILTNFTDDKEKSLIAWQAEGADENTIPLTSDELDALTPAEATNTPETDGQKAEQQPADRMIEVHIGALEYKRNEIPANTTDPSQLAERAKYEQKINLLKSAIAVPGVWGAFARRQAVGQMIKSLGEGAKIPPSLEEAQRQLDKDSRTDQKAFLDSLDGKVSAEDLASLREFIGETGDIEAKILELLNPASKNKLIKSLHENPDYDFANKLVEGTDKDKLFTYLDQMIETMPDNVKSNWQKLRTGGKYLGIGLGAIVLLLLAGTGIAMGGASKIGGQQRAA